MLLPAGPRMVGRSSGVRAMDEKVVTTMHPVGQNVDILRAQL